jgi:hypothetical protein
MLSPRERDTVFKYAYIPEHLADYVQAVSGAEPHMHEGCLCFFRDSVLIFIGYPLAPQQWEGTATDLRAILDSACRRFRPKAVNVIAPGFQTDAEAQEQPDDYYYRMDLPLVSVRPEEAYMIRRAARELKVGQGTFSEDHESLIDDFIRERDLSPAHREIFRGIPRYLSLSQTARLLEARKGPELVAFSILDLGSAEYGFYLFNFRSFKIQAPGASDFLFQEMAKLATKEGKRYLNLGLGVNSGVRRFKEKWGAVRFLPYRSRSIRKEHPGLLDTIRTMFFGYKTDSQPTKT